MVHTVAAARIHPSQVDSTQAEKCTLARFVAKVLRRSLVVTLRFLVAMESGIWTWLSLRTLRAAPGI
jgi:hypothetical protein